MLRLVPAIFACALLSCCSDSRDTETATTRAELGEPGFNLEQYGSDNADSISFEAAKREAGSELVRWRSRTEENGWKAFARANEDHVRAANICLPEIRRNIRREFWTTPSRLESHELTIAELPRNEGSLAAIALDPTDGWFDPEEKYVALVALKDCSIQFLATNQAAVNLAFLIVDEETEGTLRADLIGFGSFDLFVNASSGDVAIYRKESPKDLIEAFRREQECDPNPKLKHWQSFFDTYGCVAQVQPLRIPYEELSLTILNFSEKSVDERNEARAAMRENPGSLSSQTNGNTYVYQELGVEIQYGTNELPLEAQRSFAMKDIHPRALNN